MYLIVKSWWRAAHAACHDVVMHIDRTSLVVPLDGCTPYLEMVSWLWSTRTRILGEAFGELTQVRASGMLHNSSLDVTPISALGDTLWVFSQMSWTGLAAHCIMLWPL